VSPHDLDLLMVTDDPDEIVRIIAEDAAARETAGTPAD
jgi:hypothetical protein